MKKLFVLLISFLLMGNAFASTADLFHYDTNKVKTAFINADALDMMVSATQATLNDLDMNVPLLANFKAETSSMMMSEDVMGIPAFWWGCILGVIGILIVYLVSEDSEATKKALWGCVVGYLFWGVVWVVYYGLILGAWSAAGAY